MICKRLLEAKDVGMPLSLSTSQKPSTEERPAPLEVFEAAFLERKRHEER